MIVLETSKQLQTFIGLYRRNQSNLKDVLYMIFMNVVFISNMFGVLIYGSIHFIWVNYADLGNTTNAVIVLMAGSSGIGCYCGIAAELKSIQKLYDKLQHLADESNVDNFLCNFFSFSIFHQFFKKYFIIQRFEISWVQWFSRS